MSSQDRDLAKLKRLANIAGLRVYFRKYSRHTDMAAYDPGKSISIYESPKSPKTETILSFLHELGHHFDWITNPKEDADTKKAYREFDAKDFKKYVKIIVNVEKAGIRRMLYIHKLLDLEIPIEKVKRQQKIDLHHYLFFYKNRRFPSGEEARQFENKLDGKRKKRRI